MIQGSIIFLLVWSLWLTYRCVTLESVVRSILDREITNMKLNTRRDAILFETAARLQKSEAHPIRDTLEMR
jgi:hypothetical protein